MNYNILGYSIYLIFTFIVIVKVGLLCYKHGKIYSLQIFNNDVELTERTNNILLLCYYLFNLGYCLVTIYTWQKINDWQHCIASVCSKAGLILLSVGILHLINIVTIIYISHKQKFHSQLN
jgi:DNA modification methylase